MHLSFDSEKSLAALKADLVRACGAGGFHVVGTTDSADRAREAGAASARGSFVVELRDPLPQIAGDGGHAAGTTWRVAGYEVPRGGTRLSTIRPSNLVDLLGHPELAAAALRLEKALETALATAAHGGGPGAAR